MTKKGFTLIELLAVIVILGIILAIAIPSVTDVLSSSKEKLYNSEVLEIEKAAKIYTIKYSNEIEDLDIKGYGYITLTELSDKGIIDSVINPKTSEAFGPAAVVKVTRLPNNDYQFDFLIDGIPD